MRVEHISVVAETVTPERPGLDGYTMCTITPEGAKVWMKDSAGRNVAHVIARSEVAARLVDLFTHIWSTLKAEEQACLLRPDTAPGRRAAASKALVPPVPPNERKRP